MLSRPTVDLSIFAPLLLIVYVVVFELSRNVNQGIRAQEVISVTAALFAVVLVSLISFKFVIRKRTPTAAFGSLLIWVLVFLYGPLQSQLHQWLWDSDQLFTLSRHRGLLPIIAIAILLVFVWMARSDRDFRPALKITSLVLVVLIGFNSLVLIDNRRAVSVPDQFQPPDGIPQIDGEFVPNNRPDIYYILLDGYGREDVLLETAGFDNSEFLGRILDQGFAVAELPTTNYNFTAYSIPSALNMGYIELEDVNHAFWRYQQGSILNPDQLIQNSTAGEIAAKIGYKVRGIDASTSKLKKDAFPLFGPFSGLLRDLTPLKIDLWQFNYFWVRQLAGRNLADNMSRLLSVIEDPEPNLTFLYVGAPHPPFLYDRKGEFQIGAGTQQQGWRPESKYIEQLEYVNTLVENLVGTIIQDSDEEPVIILTSDHGPHFQVPEPADEYRHSDEAIVMQAGILLATHSASSCPIEFPDEVTHVNVLRRVFNGCWGTSFEDLPNKTYIIPNDGSNKLRLVVD